MTELSLSEVCPGSLPWEILLAPTIAAEDALARLDERLSRSNLREGWIARTHFADASASLWNDGETVHVEDLVLHEAGMDVNLPTQELSKAMHIIRARRQLQSAEPRWAFTDEGLDRLRGKYIREEAYMRQSSLGTAVMAVEAEFDDVLVAVERSIDRVSDAVTEAENHHWLRDTLVYDPDWDEEERLMLWKSVVQRTESLPATVAVAICFNAWERIQPLQHLPWLGTQLSAALFRARAKTQSHLFCLNVGLRKAGNERPRKTDLASQIVRGLKAIRESAELGLKEHDRWLNAYNVLSRKLRGRRSTSRLSALIDLAMRRPLISASLVAKELKITPRAAQTLIAELGLRETTGRSRYRAWAIL